MAVTIIQCGMKKPPLWAGTCPDCGEAENGFEARKLVKTMEMMNRTCVRIDGAVEMAATYKCRRCGCIWQWYD